MTQLLQKAFKDDSGATSLEYAFIAALISILIAGSATAIGGTLEGFLSSTSDGFGRQ